jgi:hypothetical protein
MTHRVIGVSVCAFEKSGFQFRTIGRIESAEGFPADGCEFSGDEAVSVELHGVELCMEKISRE